MTDDAIAWDDMVHTEATAADDFAHTDDEATQTEADDVGADQAADIVPEAQADETQSSGDATANANFTIAQANQTAAEWSSLAASLGIPWAQAQAGIAAALATWATTAASNYQAFVAKLGLAETDYATSDVTQFTNEFKKIDLADFTDANAVADADEILADTLADDEMGTEQATATGDDGFWVSVGEANHDYRVAQAEAIHDALVGGPMADYTAAMTVAAADKAAALNGAITQFHVVVDPAVASQTTNDAQATFTDDKAFDDAQLDDTTQADEAADTYSDLESGDYDTEQRADNHAVHDRAISDADGQTAAVVAYDQSNPSPWADQAAASAQAQATLSDAQAGAELTADNAAADAQEAQETSQADAAESEDIANAQSSHDSAVDQSQQAEDLASSSAISEPDPLVAPNDGTPATLTPDYIINYAAGALTLKNSSEDFLSLPKAVPSFGENQEPGAPNMMPLWDPASIQLPWGNTMPYGLTHTFTPGNFLVVPGYSLFYTMPLADSSITTGSDYESSISPGMTVTLAGGNWANGTPSSASNQSSVLFAAGQQAGGNSGGGNSGNTTAAAAKGPVQGADTNPMDAEEGKDKKLIDETVRQDGNNNVPSGGFSGMASTLIEYINQGLDASRDGIEWLNNYRNSLTPQQRQMFDMIVQQAQMRDRGNAAGGVKAGVAGGAAVGVAASKLSAADAEIASVTQHVIAKMQAEGWTPKKPTDGGAFGTEVHKRVSKQLAGKQGWYMDVYVDKETNVVISIGKAPPGVDPKTYTQVDAIRGKDISVGVTLGNSNVEEVYDIKTAARGKVMDPDQLERLKKVKLGAGAEDIASTRIKTVTPSHRYTASSGWQPHPRYGETGVKLLSFLGPALSAYLLLSADIHEGELRKLFSSYQGAEKDPTKLALWLFSDLEPFLKKFIDDDVIVRTTLFALNAQLSGRR